MKSKTCRHQFLSASKVKPCLLIGRNIGRNYVIFHKPAQPIPYAFSSQGRTIKNGRPRSKQTASKHVAFMNIHQNISHSRIFIKTCPIHEYSSKHAPYTNIHQNMSHTRIFAKTCVIHEYSSKQVPFMNIHQNMSHS